MVCDIGREFLCTSISSLRVTEDSIAALLVIFIMIGLIKTIYKVVKEGPLVKRLWGFVIGLIPFLLWKGVGSIRRIFLENPSFLLSYEFGELYEALTAVTILASFAYFYFFIKKIKIKLHK